MTDMFPRARFPRQGYHRAQVDAFFDLARAAYERPMLDEATMSAAVVRNAAFDLKVRGYVIEDVDLALDRLEVALAQRAKEQFVRANGQQAWMATLAQRAQVLYPRLRRPRGQRFDKPGRGAKGYDARQVDALLDRLVAFFDTGAPITPQELRTATFTKKSGKGSYDEKTVDVYLDRAIDILQGAMQS